MGRKVYLRVRLAFPAIFLLATMLWAACDASTDQKSAPPTPPVSPGSPVPTTPPPPVRPSGTSTQPQGGATTQPQGRAFLTITRLEVSPSTVNRGQAFTVKMRVENQGAGPSGSFGVEVRANVKTPTSATSYPIGSGGKPELQSGEGADFTFVSAHGVNQAGIYTVRASFVNPKDRHDPSVPERRLIVN